MKNIITQKLLVLLMLFISAISMRVTNDGTFFVMALLLFCPILFQKSERNKRK